MKPKIIIFRMWQEFSSLIYFLHFFSNWNADMGIASDGFCHRHNLHGCSESRFFIPCPTIRSDKQWLQG